MNRRDFIKVFGITALAATLSPDDARQILYANTAVPEALDVEIQQWLSPIGDATESEIATLSVWRGELELARFTMNARGGHLLYHPHPYDQIYEVAGAPITITCSSPNITWYATFDDFEGRKELISRRGNGLINRSNYNES